MPGILHIKQLADMWLFCGILCSFVPRLHAQVQTPGDPFDVKPLPDATLTVSSEYPPDFDMGKLLAVSEMIKRQGDHGMFGPARLSQRQSFITNTPDIDRYLVWIADQRIEQHSSEMSDVLDALSLRPDIGHEVVERYIQRARMLLTTKSPQELDQADTDYVRGIVSVLAAKPTRENEDLLIQILQYGFRWPVAQALAKMGTIRALPAMEEAVSVDAEYARKNSNDSVMVRLNELKENLAALRSHLAATAAKPTSSSDPAHKNEVAARSADAVQNTDSPTSASSKLRQLMVAIVAVASLTWLLLKRRK